MDMEQNVGGLDRTARLVAGPLLLLVGIAVLAEMLEFGTVVGVAAVVVGAVFLGTGLTQRCLLHRIFGINTCKR